MGELEQLHKDHFRTINTQRLTLRPFIIEDAPDMFAYTSVPENFCYLKRNHHTHIQETEAFLAGATERYRENRDFLWGITLKETGQLIGTCRLFGFDFDQKSAEVSYMASPKFQGRGYVSESVRGLIAYAFGELGLCRIQARCVAENIASERVMQASEMKFEKELYDNGEAFLNKVFKLYAVMR